MCEFRSMCREKLYRTLLLMGGNACVPVEKQLSFSHQTHCILLFHLFNTCFLVLNIAVILSTLYIYLMIHVHTMIRGRVDTKFISTEMSCEWTVCVEFQNKNSELRLQRPSRSRCVLNKRWTLILKSPHYSSLNVHAWAWKSSLTKKKIKKKSWHKFHLHLFPELF